MTALKTTLYLLSMLLLFPSYSDAIKIANITLVVVGEDGSPIEDAKVYILRDGPGGVAAKGSSSKSETDSSGKHTFTMINYNGYLAYGASKDGYYESNYQYQFKTFSFWHWKPWGEELRILLRKIQNPVPMYARKSRVEVPVLNKPIGFDLILHDWVAPYGKGLHPDFIFTFDRNRAVDWKDFDGILILTFHNKHDGIQIWRERREKGSIFSLPYLAPLDGYANKLELRELWRPGDNIITRNFNFISDDINYIFRIRSEEENGKLIRALYGKIRGYLSFQFVYSGGKNSETTSIGFTYYVNPNYSRNLEFDPKLNLFQNLKLEENTMNP